MTLSPFHSIVCHLIDGRHVVMIVSIATVLPGLNLEPGIDNPSRQFTNLTYRLDW
jgi:hypothetical protein